eukprot:1309983-Rhodomonas_salina.4
MALRPLPDESSHVCELGSKSLALKRACVPDTMYRSTTAAWARELLDPLTWSENSVGINTCCSASPYRSSVSCVRFTTRVSGSWLSSRSSGRALNWKTDSFTELCMASHPCGVPGHDAVPPFPQKTFLSTIVEGPAKVASTRRSSTSALPTDDEVAAQDSEGVGLRLAKKRCKATG